MEDFNFPLEVYEQGRISRLREDIARQLDMLDQFAGLEPLLETRAETIAKLNESAENLAPLYDEQDQLASQVDSLPALKQQLAALEKLSPGEEDKKWGTATTVVESLEECISDLSDVGSEIPKSGPARATGPSGDLERLFAQQLPKTDLETVAEAELLGKWILALTEALTRIATARSDIAKIIDSLVKQSAAFQVRWNAARSKHERIVSDKLAKAGVESPKEIIEKAKQLRKQIDQIEGSRQRRLTEVRKLVDRREKERETLLVSLEDVNLEVSTVRLAKAQELTNSLDGQIRITLEPSGDTTEYRTVLDGLCKEIGSPSHRVRDRESQIDAMVSRLSPLALARALKSGGVVIKKDSSSTPLHRFCPGVTENTVKLLVGMAEDIRALNRLQTATISGLPRILVRRRSESTYGELSTGLSPGEQSAAILTVALQTRTMPLILDQPEDELGYSYVVHLIVPKILSAKALRQLVVVTHNANIPVLGDADYVTRMENRPRQEGERECVVSVQGCFENSKVTAALLELEGGSQAFRFRHHRYALPDHGGIHETSPLLRTPSVGRDPPIPQSVERTLEDRPVVLPPHLDTDEVRTS